MPLLHSITVALALPFPLFGFAPQRQSINYSLRTRLYQQKVTKSIKPYPLESFRTTPLKNVVEDVLENILENALVYVSVGDALKVINEDDVVKKEKRRNNYKSQHHDDDTLLHQEDDDDNDNIMKEINGVANLVTKEKTQEVEEKLSSDTPPPMKMSDAVSIIAGTAIGGGFLALPSVTNPIGYFPSVLGLVLVWSYLLLSSTAFVEAVGLVAAEQQQEQLPKGGDEETAQGTGAGGTSVATVIRHAFGNKWAALGGIAFVAQMFAVVTAQVVKGALLTTQLAGVPYFVGCVVPTFGIGLFAFLSKPEVAERANTILTAMMIGGFVALMCSTVATGKVGPAAASLFQRANWSRLLPSMKASWAMPVFINLLCFGQAMPLVVERMLQSSSPNGDNSSSTTSSSSRSVSSPLSRARSAALVGSGIPLVLSVIWAAISTALVAPSATDPIKFLLGSSPAIALPVLLLAIGAIGTTLLGSFLAMGHFAVDIIANTKFGGVHGDHDSSSTTTPTAWKKRVAEFSTVLIPCGLACAGPELYLPLLAFAGAYPTTILYGLVPSLAAIVLRRRANNSNIKAKGSERAALQSVTAPKLVPGGQPTLIALTTTAIGLLSASTILAIRHAMRAARLAFL